MANALPPARYIHTQNTTLLTPTHVFYVECSLPVNCTIAAHRATRTTSRKRSIVQRIFGL